MPAKHSHVYLFAFPRDNLLKIGKADDPRTRLSQLTHSWGPLDHEHLYSIRVASAAAANNLERALQKFLDSFAHPQSDGAGKTEMFVMKALKPALSVAKVYRKSHPETQITAGLPRDNEPKATPVKIDWKARRALTIQRGYDLACFLNKKTTTWLTKAISFMERHGPRVIYRKHLSKTHLTFLFWDTRPSLENDLDFGIGHFILVRLAYHLEGPKLWGTVRPMVKISYKSQGIAGWIEIAIELSELNRWKNEVKELGTERACQYVALISELEKRFFTLPEIGRLPPRETKKNPSDKDDNYGTIP